MSQQGERMSAPRLRLWERLERAVWVPRFKGSSTHDQAGRFIRFMRYLAMLIGDLMSGELTLRAMSLAYVTLVSMVPFLALSFSVLKAFGVHHQIEPMLLNLLAPLGAEAEDLTRRIVAFVAGTNVRLLGTIGLALLLYTAVALVQRIEESFNFIWHVSSARSIGEQFVRYVSVLLVGPFLLFLALGVAAAVMNQELVRQVLAVEPFGKLAYWVGRVMPAVLLAGAFAFAYAFIPNTKVRRSSALVGGIIAGILWQLVAWAFAKFMASSTSYAAIYSSFAVLILFMIWVYVNWLIVLCGASIAFYWQKPQWLSRRGGERSTSNRARELLALQVAGRIATNFRTGRPPWTLERLSQSLGVPEHLVTGVVDPLCRAGVLTRTAEDPPAFVPARDPTTIAVAQLLDLVRQAGAGANLGVADLAVAGGVHDVVARIEQGIHASLAELTFADLAAATQPE